MRNTDTLIDRTKEWLTQHTLFTGRDVWRDRTLLFSSPNVHVDVRDKTYEYFKRTV